MVGPGELESSENPEDREVAGPTPQPPAGSTIEEQLAKKTRDLDAMKQDNDSLFNRLQSSEQTLADTLENNAFLQHNLQAARDEAARLRLLLTDHEVSTDTAVREAGKKTEEVQQLGVKLQDVINQLGVIRDQLNVQPGSDA